jgi:PAS domain S-box-containing protein
MGRIAWQPRRPGRDQLAWLLPAVSGALLAIVIFAGLALRAIRLARAVRVSERRLGDFADSSSDWLWETDDQLRFSWFSPGFALTTGLDPAALIGRRRDEAHGGAGDRAGRWAAHRADLAARRPFRDFVYSYVDTGGTERTARVSGKPVFGTGGRFLGYRGTGRDITAEASAARQLQESENRFRSLVENLRGILFCRGIAGGDAHGYDAQGAQVFGADAATMAGTVDPYGRARIDQWYDAIDPADRLAYLEAERLRKEQGLAFVIDYRVTHPRTGERRWMQESAWVVEAPEEGRRYLDSYIIDVTEQRAREAALAEARASLEAQNQELSRARLAAEAAAQAKSEFLAAMSHEIRTPMTSVLGMSDVLAAEPLTAAQRRYVEIIRGSGRHLLGVINSILDFSRIEAGKLELEDIDFTVGEVLEQVHSLLGPQAAERGLDLRFTPGEAAALVVRGDPTRLRQVLVNVVGNGLKFTSRGSVAVGVRQLETAGGRARLRFEVRDTGIGIPADRLPELFAPFVQADSSTLRQFGGSGLGLAICKRLTEAMGGSIGAESTAGSGSLFWFELPFALGDPAVLARRTAVDAAAIPPLRILVVDDVIVNRDMLAQMLRRQGHEVLLAEHGARAVEIAAGGGLDLVLMDVQMPVMDGMEATRRIRQLPPPLGQVPILALTANVMPAERMRYLASGMNLCLTKPVVWPDLFGALAAVATGRPAPAEPADGKAAPPPPPAADAPLLDRKLLDGLVRNTSPELFRNLFSRGLDSAEESCRRLRAALGDGAELAREAHRLRGTSGSFGLARISALAGAIEDGAGDPAGLVARLEAAVAASRQAARAADLVG